MRESVPNVNEAFLPTINVEASGSVRAFSWTLGSRNGLFSIWSSVVIIAW